MELNFVLIGMNRLIIQFPYVVMTFVTLFGVLGCDQSLVCMVFKGGFLLFMN